MHTADALRQLIVDYTEAHQEMRAVLERGEDDWRKRYLAIRRTMAEHVGTLFRMTTTLQSSGIDPASIKELQSRLSHMRHCIALHQSEWPVVAIDPGSSAYRASLRRLDEARRAMILDCEQLLRGMQRCG